VHKSRDIRIFEFSNVPKIPGMSSFSQRRMTLPGQNVKVLPVDTKRSSTGRCMHIHVDACICRYIPRAVRSIMSWGNR
jgi:hypothetical protein